MTHQIKDAEEITLRQILDQINILPKNKFYCFKAYIYEVENKANPWYEACSNCSKSVNKTMKTRSCNNCIDFNISIVSRYRITMSVNDGTATASVTLFGNVANVFIGCSVEDYIDSITKDDNTSIYYKHLETPNREEYTFLLKMDKSVEIKDGTLAFVIEGIQNPSTIFNNKNVASKKRSIDFEQEDIKKKRGSPTNIINDIGIQIIEDHDNTNTEIKDDEIIASPARKDFQHKKIQKKEALILNHPSSQFAHTRSGKQCPDSAEEDPTAHDDFVVISQLEMNAHVLSMRVNLMRTNLQLPLFIEALNEESPLDHMDMEEHIKQFDGEEEMMSQADQRLKFDPSINQILKEVLHQEQGERLKKNSVTTHCSEALPEISLLTSTEMLQTLDIMNTPKITST
ncbi:uncharacterized protein LOC142523904 [Primulina tabacum]|uniref:uncharacterized protein LOC142523904 n=1 Tax=Primulina tabacum TaxID=48773 RepID=UPI003F59A6E5